MSEVIVLILILIVLSVKEYIGYRDYKNRIKHKQELIDANKSYYKSFIAATNDRLKGYCNREYLCYVISKIDSAVHILTTTDHDAHIEIIVQLNILSDKCLTVLYNGTRE